MSNHALLAIAFAALTGCAHGWALEGYETKLSRAAPHHPPSDYYLAIDPADPPTVRPVRDEAKLVALWHDAARHKCGNRDVQVIYGPTLATALSQYCAAFPGESDCGPSVHGYFLCRQ